MLRGTVITHRRRCGKPNCRCASGEELHEQVILTYSLHSKAHSVSLPGELIGPVSAAADRYRKARQKLEAEANAGLAELVRSLGPTQVGCSPSDDAFFASRVLYEGLIAFLAGTSAAGLTHAELESQLDRDGRELICQLYQDHPDLRAKNEERLNDVVATGGAPHRAVEANHTRPLSTIFGSVCVRRLAYRHRGEENLYPADAALNLPEEVHSHGLRKLSAIESTRGSFEEAREAIRRASGVEVGKRQVEQLAQRSAVDFEDFYETTAHEAVEGTDVRAIVKSCGSKVSLRRRRTHLRCRCRCRCRVLRSSSCRSFLVACRR